MESARRGSLRVFLGAAPGVGKTCALLAEGVDLLRRGERVEVGWIDTKHREGTEAAALEFERVGGSCSPRPVDLLLRARPSVVLLDDLESRSRLTEGDGAPDQNWQLAERLLDAGIDVVATIDASAIESIAHTLEGPSGEARRDRVPDRLLRSADQIEFLDKTPEQIRRRLADGSLLSPDDADADSVRLFDRKHLATLRTKTLQWLADHTRDDRTGTTGNSHERVVVALSGAPDSVRLVRRAAELAARSGAEMLGVCILQTKPVDSPYLEEARRLLIDLGGAYHEVRGVDVATDLVDFALAERATQLVIGASPKSVVRRSVISKVIAAADTFDVHVVRGTPSAVSERRWFQPVGRRRALGAALGLTTIPTVTAMLAFSRDRVSLSTSLLLYVLVVVVLTSIGGATVGFTAAVAAFFCANYFLIEPTHTFAVTDRENLAALLVFLLVAAIVSSLVHIERRRASEAQIATVEAEAVARSAALLAQSPEPTRVLMGHLHDLLGGRSISLETREAGRWQPWLAEGGDVAEGAVEIGVDQTHRLRVGGPPLPGALRRLATSIASQLHTAIATEAMRERTDRAREHEAGDAYRTSLLRAVSHDLRTPLTSVKASVTSLLASDVEWSAADVAEFLGAIDAGADRLDHLITDLLDMSRLEAGAVRTVVAMTELIDVVDAVLASLPSDAAERCVVIEERAGLRGVVDRALLERVLANMVLNALRASEPSSCRPTTPVTVRLADGLDGFVEIWVVDQGRGIPEHLRVKALEPFQRLSSETGGLGLGLAIANGLVEAMGCTLLFDDTPGGGLTVKIGIPAGSTAPRSRATPPTPRMARMTDDAN